MKFVICVIFAAPSFALGAISNPVKDYRDSFGAKEERVMAVRCDLDGDGIDDFFVADGAELDSSKGQGCSWAFYRGENGGYVRFEEAHHELGTGEGVSIFFSPHSFNLMPSPDGKGNSIFYSLMKSDADGDHGSTYTYVGRYFFEGGMVKEAFVKRFEYDKAGQGGEFLKMPPDRSTKNPFYIEAKNVLMNGVVSTSNRNDHTASAVANSDSYASPAGGGFLKSWGFWILSVVIISAGMALWMKRKKA